jgi:uncharacterized protein
VLYDPSFYAAALPAVVLYGLSKGGFSGVGLLAMPLLALVMSPVQAAAIMLPVLLAQDVVTIYSYRHDWNGRMLALMLPGALVGIILGGLTAALVSPSHIRVAVGLLAIAFCVNAWFGARIAAWFGSAQQPTALRPHNVVAAAGLSAMSSYTSFVIHAGGPPFNMYALPRLRDTAQLVGTSGVYFGLLNLMKLPPYLALGQLTATNLQLSAVLLPVAVAGNLFGIWLVRRIPKELFFRIIYALTFLVGLKLLVDGLRG